MDVMYTIMCVFYSKYFHCKQNVRKYIPTTYLFLQLFQANSCPYMWLDVSGIIRIRVLVPLTQPSDSLLRKYYTGFMMG